MNAATLSKPAVRKMKYGRWLSALVVAGLLILPALDARAGETLDNLDYTATQRALASTTMPLLAAQSNQQLGSRLATLDEAVDTLRPAKVRREAAPVWASFYFQAVNPERHDSREAASPARFDTRVGATSELAPLAGRI